MFLMASGIGIALLQHGGDGTQRIFQCQLQLAGMEDLLLLRAQISLLGMARLQAIGEVVGQLDEELLLLLAEQPWLVAVNDQRTGLILLQWQGDKQAGAQRVAAGMGPLVEDHLIEAPLVEDGLGEGLIVQPQRLFRGIGTACLRHDPRRLGEFGLALQHCDQRKTVIDGDGIADILQQLWLIARFEQGVVGAADRLLGPSILLQFLLLPLLLGNVFEEDADPHDDPASSRRGNLVVLSQRASPPFR